MFDEVIHLCTSHSSWLRVQHWVGMQEMLLEWHWIYLQISSAPFQSLINALSSVSSGWIQRLYDPSNVRNLSPRINRMASLAWRVDSTRPEKEPLGDAPGWEQIEIGPPACGRRQHSPFHLNPTPNNSNNKNKPAEWLWATCVQSSRTFAFAAAESLAGALPGRDRSPWTQPLTKRSSGTLQPLNLVFLFRTKQNKI